MKSLPPAKKAEVLRALASSLKVEEVLEREGISSAQLKRLLSEAGELFGKKGRAATGTLVAYIDGASRNNPGPSAAGVVIRDGKGTLIEEEGLYLGEGTNNAAEYKALLLAMEKARDMGAGSLVINSDSELVVNQLNGRYRVKEPRLQELYFKAVGLIGEFEDFSIVHVPREENRRADMLANKALDEYINKSKGLR